MKRPAFTLIELLAATALAALLLAAGFRVIGSLGRTRAMLARQEQARSYADEAVDLIRWDLANARYISSAGGELTLTGYGALDPETFAPRHRPVTVRYRVAIVDGEAGGGVVAGGETPGTGRRTWLVREQTDLDVATNRNRTSALVCSGVGSIAVEAVPDGAGTPAAAPATPAGGSVRGTGRPPSEGARPPTPARRPAGRPRAGATAADLTGWEGPALGLGKPEDQDDVPPAVRLVIRPDRAGGPSVDEVVYAR